MGSWKIHFLFEGGYSGKGTWERLMFSFGVLLARIEIAYTELLQVSYGHEHIFLRP